MRYFVTGASGWIGSAVTAELLASGHQVMGLARSDASADAVEAAGAEVVRGTLTDLDVLRRAAAESDGVVHTAFIHDFNAHLDAANVDFEAVKTMGDALENSGKPFVIASGILGAVVGRPLTEADLPNPVNAPSPRLLTEKTLLEFSERGIRSAAVRLAPTVHGDGDHGFIAAMIGFDEAKGSSAYIGDGSNRWPAVHRLDAAHLFCLALEKAPAGSIVHAVAEEGIPIREIAGVIGRKAGLPVVSITPEEAMDHFSWLGRFLAIDATATSAATRELLGWEPTHPTLIEDLELGHYFRA